MADIACLFPALNDGVSHPQHVRQAVDIDAAVVEAVAFHCQQTQTPVQFCLATIWAIILGQYTDADRHVMGMAILGTEDGDDGQQCIMWPKERSTASIQRLCKAVGWETAPCSSLSSPTDYNTSIVITADPNPLETKHLHSSPDIQLIYEPLAQPTRLRLQYRLSILSQRYAELLKDAVTHVIGSVVDNPYLALQDISTQIFRTHRQQIQQWNSHPVVQPRSTVIHSLIHEHSVGRPTHTAIHAWDEKFTYAELDILSSRLAAHLQDLQIGPGSMVATCFEKSGWAIVALLAINKAGAAFVPLEPTNPRTRIKAILKQTKASAVLVNSTHHEDVLKELVPIRVTVSRGFLDNLAREAVGYQVPAVEPTDPAYCLFTSGSTGAPRGCLVSHHALTSVANHSTPLRIHSTTRTLQFASMTFGISIIEIWCTLSAGGTLCIPSEQDRSNRLAAVMRDMDVTWALMTPTTTQVLQPSKVPSLCCLGIAGEPLPKAQIDVWASALCLFQAYGLTEWAGICAVSRPINPSEPNANIGYCTGGRFWLVSPENFEILAPIGAEAELLIEGPSLALGYLEEPQRTAEAFIAPPTWYSTPSQKSSGSKTLYKTGDIVRYRSDGSLEYLSRKGTQVKLRGQRIELSEVEYHVAQISRNMKKVVVEIVQPEGADGQPTLAAFLYSGNFSEPNGDTTAHPQTTGAEDGWFMTADDQLRSTIAKISTSLGESLPSYMVPQLFLPLQHLPVTTSGKVNRRQLREMVRRRDREWWTALTQDKKPIISPRTDAEALIHSWVVQVLKLSPDNVGMADDFFTLGGDSALAMKLVSVARQQLVKLQVVDVLENPTLVDLARMVEEQAGAFQSSTSSSPPFYLLRQEGMSDTGLKLLLSTTAEQCDVAPEDVEDMYPCTPMQETLMAWSTTHAGLGLAIFQYHLQPDVDIDRLKAAWQETVNTNPILRTRIAQLEGNGMMQVVLRPGASKSISLSTPKETLGSHPVKPGSELLTTEIKTKSDGSSLLVVAINHALCDRWSMSNIMRQLEMAYWHQSIPTPPSFASFVKEVSAQRNDSRVRQYWREQLTGLDAEEFPSLPIGYRAVPRSQLEQSTTLPVPIPHGVTASNLLRLAWATVIAAHTSCDDVLFGTIVSGRGAAVDGIEQMSGPAIANVPLRIQLHREERIDHTLARLGQQFLEMIPYEQVGMQNLCRDGNEAMAAACRFNSHLVVQPYWEPPSQKLWAAYNADAAITGGFASSALSLVCWLAQDPRDIRIEAIFDEKVIPAARVHQLLDQLQHVLHQAVRHPHHTIDSLSVTTDHDMQLLQQWNVLPTPRLPAASVGDLLHVQVAQHPDSLAVCAWDGNLTYRELDVESSRLVNRLVDQGVAAHDLVPILLGRSKWTPVAMWATIKVGATFILLDPTHPTERLQSICTSVKNPIIVSSARMGDQSSTLSAQIVVVDGGWDHDSPSTQPNGHTAVSAREDDALYVVFTSGSTGKPKGVVIEHRSFCASALAHNPIHQIGPTSRVLQNASHAFDISIMEILSTLLVGGCVCIPSEKQLRDEFVETANRLQVTHAFLTPSAARAISLDQVKSLRSLILGGESLRTTDASWLRSRTFRMVHEYGPAECSITATAQEALQGDSVSKTIGFPMGCRCWVVDRRDPERLSPIGAVGELIIEGPNVGRGYLNDPERTAASFIAPPSWLRNLYPENSGFWSVYKTGDLVHYREDGALEYVERKDLQVKLRGQRIELEEVERHVQRLWSPLREVIVELAGLGENKIPSLVAFIGPDQGVRSVTGRDLILPSNDAFKTQFRAVEEQLQSLLSPTMIPTLFLAVHQIPIGATGKINRQSLRAAAEQLSAEELQLHRGNNQPKRSPVTREEKILCQLWASVLGINGDSVGLDDHFFRLGGDSLSAMDLVARCQTHGLGLMVSQIFSQPTLVKQAQLLCESPRITVAAVPAPFSLLGDSKEDVFRTAVEQCQVPRDHIDDIYPCTPLQEGLLALTARDPMAYIGQWIYRLPDGVDLERLRCAWVRVAQAHPILRTRMVQAPDNRLYQVVCRGSPHWQVWDSPDKCDLQRIRAQMTLGQPQTDLVFCPAQECCPPRLVLTMHHASYDQNSMVHIMRDVHTAYQDQTDLVPRPFSPFIRYLQDTASNYTHFWQHALEDFDADPFPELPSPSYRPAPSMVLEKQWALKEVANARSSVTFTTKIYLAWAITQSQYQRNQDVVFGVTVSGRSASLPGIQTMTGPTLATIPLRLQMAPDDSLSVLLQATQEMRASAIPYEQAGLQNISRCGPDAAQATAFQTLLIVQQDAEANETYPTLLELMESVTGWTAFTTYALLLSCTLSKDGRVTVQASFDPKVISPEQTDRVLSFFDEILQLLHQGPDLLLRDIQSISLRDREQIIRWNDRLEPATVRHCVHDMIQEKCVQDPNALAVCAWDGAFTYGELDSLAFSLAAQLAAQGVGPGTPVPLYFEKSRWTSVAILAVLKAGGAFVLLDPSHPLLRLQAICEQLDSPVLVVSEQYTVSGAVLCPHSVTVGDHHRQWTEPTAQFLCAASDPNRALYIVFTSGSSGQPKGVIIEHKSYATAARAHIPLLKLTRNSRVLQFAAYAFDVSIMDHLSTFMVGGCVCVPSESQRRDGLVAAVETLQPTHAMLTPSFARSIQDPDNFSSLEVVSVIGEKVQAVDIQKWVNRVHFVNAYGPAECSVVSTIQDRFDHLMDPSNIGFAVGGTCWVVDPEDANRLTPIGVPGELLIEGSLVGRGYLGLPEKTTEVFISPPSWLQKVRPGPTRRLYKTGDLVRYAEDGSMIYLGRKDTQVKVRGQRLELGEVETRVHQCFSGATDTVAEVVELNGQSALVAFVLCPLVMATKQDPNEPTSIFQPANDIFHANVTEAESQLHQLLPEYMVPSLFLPLAHMPRGSSGKADRRRLRETAAGLSQHEIRTFRPGNPDGQSQELSTESERILQAVWSQVLGLPQSSIGGGDHFFRLGGDSIIAMKAAPLARDHGVNITVADIFDHPKLCDLASIATQQPLPESNQVTPFSLSPVSNHSQYFACLHALGLSPAKSELSDIFPVTAAQSFFLDRRTTHHYTFSLTGPVDVALLQSACGTVFAKHSILRTLFARHEGQMTQLVLQGMKLPFQHIEDISDLTAFQSSLWASDSNKLEILLSMPTRFILLSSKDRQQHVFIIRLMHAQWDAVSIPVLFNDISLAYNGQSVPRSTDFPAFLYKRAQEPRESALRFWREMLIGSTLTSVPTLPGNVEDPIRTLWKNQDISPPPETPAGITMATLVKASWAYVLSQTTGHQDVTFTQTVNGRGLPLKDADRILGPCLNFIPVRLQIQSSTLRVRDLLDQVQNQHTQSLRHEFIEWSELVQHGTCWPKQTEYQSIVQHQNFDFHYKMPLDGLGCTFSLEHNFTPRSELFIFTYPMPDRLLVQVCVSTAIMSEPRAVYLLDRLCSTIETFARHPDHLLCDLPTDPSTESPK